MNPIAVYKLILDALTAMKAVGGDLNGAKVGLYTNVHQPSKGTLLADLTQATYTGYALVAIATWGAPFLDPIGNPTMVGNHIQFQPTDGAVPNTITGWFIVDSAGTDLLIACALPTPVVLADASHALIVEPTVVYGQ